MLINKKKWLGMKHKKAIETRKRNLFLLTILILLVVSFVGTAWSYATPTEETEEIQVYAYTQRADIDYHVYMGSNALFPDKVVDPGRAYITALAENLSTNFSYHFTGDGEAIIKGQYQTTALLSAYTGRGNESMLVWSKEYILSSSKNITSNNGKVFLEETIDIPLSEYLAFVESVNSETGFTPGELRLDIDYDINLGVESAEGLIAAESVMPGLTVFLGGNTFTVDVENMNQTNGGIFQERIVAVPWVSFVRKALFVNIGVFVLGLFAVIFLTISNPDIAASRKNELSTIFKRYGDRIVKTTSELPAYAEKALEVPTFDELIKVADELGRPIVLHQPVAIGNPYIFQVTTPEQIFSCKIVECQ